MKRLVTLNFFLLASAVTAALAAPSVELVQVSHDELRQADMELARMQVHEAVAVNYWLVESFLSGRFEEGLSKVIGQDSVVKTFAQRWDPLVVYPDTPSLLVQWRQLETSGEVDFHLVASNVFGGTVEVSRQFNMMDGFVRMTNVPQSICEVLLVEKVFATVKELAVVPTDDRAFVPEQNGLAVIESEMLTCSDGGNDIVWRI